MLSPAPLRVAPRTVHHHRSLSRSAVASKALPFFLRSSRAGTHPPKHDASNHEPEPTLRMIMFGKPGAGKGTLSARLVRKYDILSLSTGDLLRQHIAEKTEVGRTAEEIVAKGGLLPDEIMLRVVTSKLDHLHNKHWILDGFPRTLGQGQLLDAHLRNQNTPLSLIVNLDVPDEIILSRISDRWVHLPSGRVYNLSYNRPKVAGHDDETGEPLTKRPDDNPEIFARRLAQFYASTSPLLSYYSASASSAAHPGAKMVSLRGTTSDEIWPQLDRAVRLAAPGLRERLEERKKTSLSEAVLARDTADNARRAPLEKRKS
ncbi:ADK-domain-containing protein [Artomyces pyxidatus]|uniref:ADK-domain-containing protein n=1 Tax=Artomyces pyxidatus TaxID=48021 RepID=A0ACB8T982_9AGAM|nr:ADK-domain-containing protein [Artomyces pyxidatus]